jgi:hypothetical protein
MKNIQIKIILFVLVVCFNSCSKSTEGPPVPEAGHIAFNFSHHVDGQPLRLDEMIYINTAGNPYEVSEIMYFISDVTLHKSDGTKKLIDEWKDICYVDTNIPSTLTWEVYDDIEVGTYDSISFTFGIAEEKNQSFMFVDPPEVQMMWPDILGGGYHYMMLNGIWSDEHGDEHVYNFHLGIGQLYKSDVINYDSIYGYVQNYFFVTLPNSSFIIERDITREVEIVMNIESWFATPHDFDFNYWGGAIMEIQPAMQMGKENGFDVFTTGGIK